MKQYYVVVTFDDGDEISTRINGEDKQDVINYYLGKRFPYYIYNIDNSSVERFHTAISVDVKEINATDAK